VQGAGFSVLDDLLDNLGLGQLLPAVAAPLHAARASYRRVLLPLDDFRPGHGERSRDVRAVAGGAESRGRGGGERECGARDTLK
jgi:hypothetical protein